MPRNTPPKEKRIELRGKMECERRGWLVFKLRMLGGRGWPDHTVIAPMGRVGFIEYKREGGKYQPLQEFWIKKLRSFGFITQTCVTEKDLENFLERFDS